VGVAGFCGLCVCLGIFVLLQCRVLCQGLQGVVVCKVGTVDWSAVGECVGGRDSVVRGWGMMRGEGEDRGESGIEGAERVVEKESNGF
jgi:hypothetical protein